MMKSTENKHVNGCVEGDAVLHTHGARHPGQATMTNGHSDMQECLSEAELCTSLGRAAGSEVAELKRPSLATPTGSARPGR